MHKVFAVLFLSSAFAVIKVQSHVEISCSAFLYGDNDWKVNTTVVPIASNCINEVLLVRRNCGGTKINFVVTQFWLDALRNGNITGYGTKYGEYVVPINNTLVSSMVRGMYACFLTAVANGFTTLEITPHVDDGSNTGAWRNTLSMNPLQKYDGVYSYYDTTVQPIVLALNAVLKSNPNTKVYLSLQGEMNLMLWKFPREWHRIIKGLRCIMPRTVKLGLSLNYNKLCGDYCNSQQLSTFNMADIAQLLNDIDFLGMSSYPTTSAFPSPSDFGNAARALASEFTLFHFDLLAWSNNPAKEFHFSEFGVGGKACDGRVATTPDMAVACPFYGIEGDFKAITNPWGPTHMQSWLGSYYGQLATWASQGTGPDIKVTAIYVWNVASWDVMGIYHASTSVEGSYKSDAVVRIVKKWNDHKIVV